MFRILLVSSSAYKKLGSFQSIWTIGKNWTDWKINSFSWIHGRSRAHRNPQIWETDKSGESQFTRAETLWKTEPGRKTWAVIGKLLKPHWGLLWEPDVPSKLTVSGTTTILSEIYFQEPSLISGKYWTKIHSCVQQRQCKKDYFETYQHTLSLNKTCTQRKWDN